MSVTSVYFKRYYHMQKPVTEMEGGVFTRDNLPVSPVRWLSDGRVMCRVHWTDYGGVHRFTYMACRLRDIKDAPQSVESLIGACPSRNEAQVVSDGMAELGIF